MAQWLRAFTVLPEETGSIPNTHLAAHNCLGLWCHGPITFSPSKVLHEHTTDMHAGKFNKIK